jgi:hypothetical protein
MNRISKNTILLLFAIFCFIGLNISAKAESIVNNELNIGESRSYDIGKLGSYDHVVCSTTDDSIASTNVIYNGEDDSFCKVTGKSAGTVTITYGIEGTTSSSTITIKDNSSTTTTPTNTSQSDAAIYIDAGNSTNLFVGESSDDIGCGATIELNNVEIYATVLTKKTSNNKYYCSIQTHNQGTITLTYKVTDDAGNTVNHSRLVHILKAGSSTPKIRVDNSANKTPTGGNTTGNTTTGTTSVKTSNTAENTATDLNMQLESMSSSACDTYEIKGQTSEEAKANANFVTNDRYIGYYVKSTCDNKDYLAFCLNPGKLGAYIYYESYTVSSKIKNNVTKTFVKYMYALYKVYQTGTYTCGKEDWKCLATWQSAARLLEFSPEAYSDYLETTKEKFPNLRRLWQNDAGQGNIEGTVISRAKALADQAKSLASTISDDESHTMSIGVTQLGTYEYTDAYNFTAKYNVIIDNYSSDYGLDTNNPGSFLSMSFKQNDSAISGYNVNFGAGTVDGTTLTIPVVLSGTVNTADCSAVVMQVALNYTNNNSDERGVNFLLSNGNGMSRQAYVVFNASGNDVSTVASTTINPGNEACNKTVSNDACPTSNNLTCGDGNSQVCINEGAESSGNSCGTTDWEACIIDHHDTQGNDYNVVNQSDLTTEQIFAGGTDALYQNNVSAILNNGNGTGTAIEASSYCTVSCKEQYQFDLPGGVKNVKQGTYFEFNTGGITHSVVGVQSARECVTTNKSYDTNLTLSSGGNIQYEKFEKIVNNLRKQQLDYLNTYLYYQAIYDKLNTDAAKNAYFAEARQNARIASINGDSGHMPGDALSSYSDKYWYTEYIPKFTTDSFKQYKLSSDTADATIQAIDTTTITNLSFAKSGQNRYFTAESYKGIYTDNGAYYEAFTYEPVIAENSKVEAGNGSPVNYEETVIDYVTCDADSDGQKDDQCPNGSHNEPRSVSWTVQFQNNDETSKLITYQAVLDKILSLEQAALTKYNALGSQLNEQMISMQTCSSYLEEEANKYSFNPQITFSYDQESYMAMLGGKSLTNANGTPNLNVTYYYCTGNVSKASDIFNCSTSVPSNNAVEYQTLPTDVAVGTKNITATPEKYYEVTRIGSRATYSCSGTYCYYKSPTPFYTYPADGLATTDSTKANSTIIANDGLIYPVTITTTQGTHPYYITFKNIGQFFETSYLGRIMGGGNGKAGTMSGESKDNEVCYYDVCPTTDPTCGNNSNGTCAKVAVSDICNKGSYKTMTLAEESACVKELLNTKETNGETCCTQASAVINAKSGTAEPDVVSAYNTACSPAEVCKSFTLIQQNGTMYDQASVDNNGELQFTVRSVSLNDLFPNNVKGTNWTSASTTNVSSTTSSIESKGESIYGDDPDYSVDLTPACIQKIKEYNETQNDSGGLDDYTGYISTDGQYKAGSASYSTFLNQLNDWGCTYTTTKNSLDAIG